METSETAQNNPLKIVNTDLYSENSAGLLLSRQKKILIGLSSANDQFNQNVDEIKKNLKASLSVIDDKRGQLESLFLQAKSFDKFGLLTQDPAPSFTDQKSFRSYSDHHDRLINQANLSLKEFQIKSGKLNKPKRNTGILVIIGLSSLCVGWQLNIGSGSNVNFLTLVGILIIGFVLFSSFGEKDKEAPERELIEQLREIRNEATEIYQSSRENEQKNAQSEILIMQDQLKIIISQFKTQLEEVNSILYPLVNLWNDNDHNNWVPVLKPLPLFSIGTVNKEIPHTSTTITTPALRFFPQELNMLFLSNGLSKEVVNRGMQSLTFKILAGTPPGKINFVFVDPIGLGQNVAPFIALSDYDDALIGGKAWSGPDQIKQQLVDLAEHIENVIQKYLRNQFKTIEQYNLQAGEIAEPYRVLVIFDFPANFNEESIRHLISIAQNGPRCGVYTLMSVDPDKPLPYGFNPKELVSSFTNFGWNGQHFQTDEPIYSKYDLSFDIGIPSEGVLNSIIARIGEKAKESSKVEVPFDKMFEILNRQVKKFATDFPGIPDIIDTSNINSLWEANSSDCLIAPLGRSGADKIQCLSLGKGTSQHALVAGKTGSGKSTLLHILITSLGILYSPNEVELYLIDFKKGVEFKTYAENRFPHARVIAIESEREFGLSVLQGLNEELGRRGELFRGVGVQNISEYRRKKTGRMPRILLLVDEFQEFFTEDDVIASQSSQILDRLVRQGRAFGVHVLLGSQTLAGAYSLARSTMDQMAVRIALQCSEADSRLILAEDNPAARLLSRPGEAIYNAENGKIEGNNNFQVGWFTEEKRELFLKSMDELSKLKNIILPFEPIIFEGNAPADVTKNRDIRYLLNNRHGNISSSTIKAWIGDPVAIHEPLAACFRRQSSSNLLMIGQKEELVMGMLAIQIVSIIAQLSIEQKPPIYILNFTSSDSPWTEQLNKLVNQFPGWINVGHRRQIDEYLNKLIDETNRRIDEDKSQDSPYFLFVLGLQRAKDLRPDENFGIGSAYQEESSRPNPSQLLGQLLRDGPEVGVHTIIWCDTFSNLSRSIERRLIREFGLKIVFQMSAEDSMNLIDSPSASKLGINRAIYFDEDLGTPEKFRPYGCPPVDWTATASSKINE